jgi:hypothetical protein
VPNTDSPMDAKAEGALPPEPALPILASMDEAVEGGRSFARYNFDEWSGEGRRFLEQMAIDAEEAFEHFRTCKSPLDAMAVQQAWLAARAKAYVDTGFRMLRGRPIAADAGGML